MRDAAFALVWLALLPLAFASAYIGVLLWIWVAMLSPNDQLYGFLAGVPFNKIVAVIALGLIVAGKGKRDLYLDGTGVLLVLFAVAATVSWYGGIVSVPNATDLYQKVLKELVLAFAAMAVFTTRRRIHLAILMVAIAFGFFAVTEGLIFLLTAGGHKVLGVPSVGDNNSLATALLMVIPMLAYLARQSAVRAVRIALWATLGLSVVTVVATYSRGGFVGLMVLGLFMVLNSRNKVRRPCPGRRCRIAGLRAGARQLVRAAEHDQRREWRRLLDGPRRRLEVELADRDGPPAVWRRVSRRSAAAGLGRLQAVAVFPRLGRRDAPGGHRPARRAQRLLRNLG